MDRGLSGGLTIASDPRRSAKKKKKILFFASPEIDGRDGSFLQSSARWKTQKLVLLKSSFKIIPLAWGRCYDHKFRRFLTIFGKKIGVFLKNQSYDRHFVKISFVLNKKRQFFR
jgi:hypothetical protein